MKPFQERVITEKVELDERLNKLDVFLASERREELPADEVGRMVEQAEAMRRYSTILASRIAHFTAS